MPPTTPEIKAILFDFGMVLSGPQNQEAWQAMLDQSGLTHDDLHKHYWTYRDDYDRGTITGREYWQKINSDANLSLKPYDIDALIAHDIDLWGDLNYPMIAWVARLHSAGFRTGILSNIGDEMERGLRSRHTWITGFDHCVWSHALKLRKPEPEIYRAAAEGLHTPPENILFIDDREENIAGAKAARMQGIQYTTHEEFEQEMNRRGLAHLLNPI